MPLTNVQIAPGFTKQVTPTGAEGQWTDGDLSDLDMAYLEKLVAGNKLLQRHCGVARIKLFGLI